MLVEEIARLVERGEITEEEVLSAITEIKCQNNFPVLTPMEIWRRAEPSENLDPLDLIPDNSPHSLQILMRINLWERWEGWKKLEKESKDVIRLVIYSNPYYSPVYSNGKLCKGKLKKELRKKYGFTHKKIEDIFKKIGQFCRELERI